MRTRQEIQTALHLLDQYGGEHKDAQTDVLHNRMTESQVFDTYVSTAPGDERNEARFSPHAMPHNTYPADSRWKN